MIHIDRRSNLQLNLGQRQAMDAIAYVLNKLSWAIDEGEILERENPFSRGIGWEDSRGNRIQVLAPQDKFAKLRGDSGPCLFGLSDLLRAMVRGTHDPDIRAALSEGLDAAGGVTVPTKLTREIIDQMRARTVVVRAGARTADLTTLKTSIARVTSDPVASWRLENAAVAESDMTFDSVQFVPRSLAVLIKMSRELLEDSLNVEEAVRNALSGAMAVEVDRVALFGSGTAPEPRGLFNTAGVSSVSMGTNGGQLTDYTKILDCLLELENANAGAPSAMILAPRTWRTIQGFVDTTGQPLTPPQALASLPQLVTTIVPINQTQGTAANASSIIVGDFAQLVLGVRSELRIELLREAFSTNMQIAFLAHLRMDVAVTQPKAFCILKGITP
ncbi:MAG: phage major capsid protein [Pseudomonadota bacterium]